MHVWLIGMMGSGKTTVGRLLAADRDEEFLDTDVAVQQRLGASIPTIWDRGGEGLFRATESAVIEEISQARSLIVATGGGAVLNAGNRNAIRRSGIAVWLEASPAELGRRIGAVRGRPLLDVDDPVGRLEELLGERAAAYADTAHHRIVTDGRTPVEVAAEAAALL